MLENTERMVGFINTLHECLVSRQKVRVNLKNVTKITPDGIVVLVSMLVRFKASMIQYVCTMPSNPECKNILKESGFLELLFKQYQVRDSYRLKPQTDNFICTHAMKSVDSQLTSNLISQFTKKIWGQKRRSKGTQRTFIELMMNTNNHASPERQGEKLWWLSVNHSKLENKVSVSFVDYGVGVFSSLKRKKPGSKFFGAYEKMKQLLGVELSDSEMLKHILHGELHKTVTEHDWRGKGLPGIYQVLKRNYYSNLNIITNTVKADVQNESYQEINANFAGTFIYWEISKNNISHDGND